MRSATPAAAARAPELMSELYGNHGRVETSRAWPLTFSRSQARPSISRLCATGPALETMERMDSWRRPPRLLVRRIGLRPDGRPTRGRPALLARAMRSVRLQDYPAPIVHTIVVDDMPQAYEDVRQRSWSGTSTALREQVWVFASRAEGESSGPARLGKLRSQ